LKAINEGANKTLPTPHALFDTCSVLSEI